MNEILAQGPGPGAWMLLAALLFAIGVYGVLTRRNLVAILVSVELMANAVNLNLVTLSRTHGSLTGQSFALFTIALTVAEVVVGLALVILVHRTHRDIDADAPSRLRG